MEAGFIGVGQMGGPMAANLSSSYKVTVYCLNDTDRSAVQASSCLILMPQHLLKFYRCQ